MLREYVCRICKKTFEFIQKFEDAPILECPECKEPALEENKIPLSSFVLVGKGWFKSGGY